MNTVALVVLAVGINSSFSPECGIDWQPPQSNERLFVPVSIGADTFKLAAGSDPEFVFQCADEADIIRPTIKCLVWAELLHQDYLNCLALLNNKSQTLAEENP